MAWHAESESGANLFIANVLLARGKDLSKKLVHYHRVPVPAFAVFPMHRKVKRPRRLALPLIVKSLIEDASIGIAQASVVETDEALAERVAFIHERIGTAAIAEQYIEGREIYVGVLGNERRRVLPIWELQFGEMAQGTRPIATEKVKHDIEYQQRHGVIEGPAKGLSPQVEARITSLVKRICRTLDLDGYARVDFRLSNDGTPYFIEANPNPEIAKSEEFSRSAQHTGLKYPDLLNRIMALGIKRDGSGPLLAGRHLALIFEKPSLRTRVSFEVAMSRLGGRALYLSDQEVRMGEREPVRDVARVLSRMVDGIAARTFASFETTLRSTAAR